MPYEYEILEGIGNERTTPHRAEYTLVVRPMGHLSLKTQLLLLDHTVLN
jgi:hypothetical protein